MITCDSCGSDQVTIQDDNVFVRCDVCKTYTQIRYMEYQITEEKTMQEINKKEDLLKELEGEKEIFNDENVPATGGFHKFKTIGDRVFGKLAAPRELQKATDPDFKDQYVYTLENPLGVSDGKPIDKADVIKVALNVDKKIANEKAAKCQPGQQIGFKYISDFETEKSKKGRANPFKVIEVYVK